MSTTTDLTVLKINYLTQAQYDNAKSQGTLEANEIYMTPVTNPGVEDVEVDGVSVVTDGVAEITMPTVPTKVSDLQNDEHFTSNTGTVTSVTVSNATNGGLTISGSPVTTSGTVTVGHSNVLTSAQTTQAVYPIKIDKNGHISAYGSAVTSMPASDVSSWAKASSKPSYTFSEIGTKPTTISGYGITDAYTKTEVDGLVSGVLHYKGTKATTSALPSSGNATGDVWHITADGSEWAWDGSTWQELGTTVDLSGYVQTSRTVNGKALTSNITLDATDVGALPSSTPIPSTASDVGAVPTTRTVNGKALSADITLSTNDLTNDSGYITEVTIDSSVVTLYTNLGLISS